MGYIIKDDITVKEPKTVTLSGLPNFVSFSGKSDRTLWSKRCQLSFASFPKRPSKEQLNLNLIVHGILTGDISGTILEKEAGGEDEHGHPIYYYDASSMEATAHNIKNAFLSHQAVKESMDIFVLPNFADNDISGYTIYIVPKLPMEIKVYNYFYPEVEVININNEFIEKVPEDNLLTITKEPEIKLEVYSDASVMLGEAAFPDKPEHIGTYLTLLRKTYTGDPLWFNLNSLFSQYHPFRLPPASGWFDAGTCRAYRFSATAPAKSEHPFYWSDILYVLNGYGRASVPDSMEEYVYSGGSVRLLSDKPRTTYIRGQREYLNFIFASSQDAGQKFGVSYRAYTTGDVLLGELLGEEIGVEALHTVNTYVLDIDGLLDEYPNAGIVRVALTVNGEIVSDNLEYEVLPECLHQLRCFSFLNRLGGWSSINFEAGVKEEIKPSIETYDTTLIPSFAKGDSLETVYRTSVTQTFTIEGAPVTNEVADWLKEFAASQVILDGDGNYVILEDFTLPVSDDNYNMQIPTLKYRLSEPYE